MAMLQTHFTLHLVYHISTKDSRAAYCQVALGLVFRMPEWSGRVGFNNIDG